MPRLWNDTVEAHREDVRAAILAATTTLVDHGGLRAVTMSRIADQAGIARATVYKYFPDAEAVLAAWHERRVQAHLSELAELCDGPRSAWERLVDVLTKYASIRQGGERHIGRGASEVLHARPHVSEAHDALIGLVRGLLVEAVNDGEVRADVPPGELAAYCLHALAAVTTVRSRPAQARLVGVVLAGLRPSPS